MQPRKRQPGIGGEGFNSNLVRRLARLRKCGLLACSSLVDRLPIVKKVDRTLLGKGLGRGSVSISI